MTQATAGEITGDEPVTARPGQRAGKLHVAVLEPDQPCPDWDLFLQRQAGASIYHRLAWRDLIRRVFGHRSYYLVGRDGDGQLRGVLPLVRLKSRLFGDFMVSMPYFNYGGALGESEEVEAVLMDYAGQLARELGVRHIEFRDTISRGGRWPERTDKAVMELALPKTSEELWAGFSSKVRAQVRRPQKERAAVAHGALDLLEDFYRVFARNMRDLGTPVYSPVFFRQILETFPDQRRILVVRLGGVPVATALLLGDNGRLEIPWASSDRRYNRLGANMLLYWEALKWATEEGYALFDFGRSTVGSGTYRFKKQWGARPRQLHWHYWLPEGARLPELRPDSRKFRLAVTWWQRLPLRIANLVGPAIVKNLP